MGPVLGVSLVVLSGVAMVLVLMPSAGRWSAAVAVALGALSFAAGRWIRLHRRIQSVASEWQLTIDAVKDPILTLDGEGRILRLNRAAMELSGRSYSENLGRLLADLGNGEPWRSASVRVAGAEAESPVGSAPVHDPETGESWEVAVSTLPYAGEGQPKTIVVARNVTELVALQQSLHREELMSAMGSLVAGVAHDMRNFSLAIQGTARLMESSIDDPQAQRRFLKMLKKQGDRMNALLRTLLDYGKPIERLQSEQRIGEVIQEAFEVCDGLAKDREVELRSHAEADLPSLLLDRTRVLQVFKNLLENAIQHSASGGRVSVETEQVGDWVESRIRDAGPGFKPEDLGQIFEPFFSRRAGGTGLGLATARRVVEQHGGRIEAANHPQGGALFRVRFPVRAVPDQRNSCAKTESRS